MSLMGHSRRFERAQATSALAPKPDILLRRGEWSEGQSPFNQQGERELLMVGTKRQILSTRVTPPPLRTFPAQHRRLVGSTQTS